MAATHGDWEAVIGLEVHAQLVTRTKAFCGCAPSFGDAPNTHTCPVCLGLPGALPVLNAEAVRLAVRAAMALDCEIAAESIFARKNYFYPDLPKGYQISQYDRPLALRGKLAITSEGTAEGMSEGTSEGSDAGGMREVGITRVHMEEDAGKNLHGVGGESIVDLNRAGTPLIEIVGEPDLRSSAEAADYLKRLRELLMFVGVCDGNMEQGSFRCDANVSVRRPGAALGTRTELKNINSFRFVGEAIDGEIRRQVALLERGERVRQQTRGYNADKRESYVLRDKENEAGYRYFPEPDLPPLLLEPGFLAAARLDLPETPAKKRARWTEALGLGAGAAGVLASHPRIAELFDRTVALANNEASSRSLAAFAVKAGNFIQAEVLRDARTSGLEATFPVTAEQLHELLALLDERAISGKQAKEVFAAISGSERMPRALVAERGMAVMSDEGALEGVIHAVIADNPKQTEAYRGGKTALLGYFVGQVMKRTGGSASPAVVNALLARHLGTPEGASDKADKSGKPGK